MSTTKIFSFNIYFWSIPTLTLACIEDQDTSVYCKEGSLRLKYADQKLPHKTLPKLKVCTPQVGYLWIIIPLHVKNSLDLFFEIGQDSKCGWKSYSRAMTWETAVKKSTQFIQVINLLKNKTLVICSYWRVLRAKFPESFALRWVFLVMHSDVPAGWAAFRDLVGKLKSRTNR